MQLAVILSFFFGIIIGSFINVFVIRYGTGRSVSGRSSCGVCGKKLSWNELIPVLSYLVLRGRCAKCGTKISFQYPLVELSTGILFALATWSSFLVAYSNAGALVIAAFAWIIIFLLVSLSVYDIRHMIIPDGMVYAFIVVTFLFGLSRLDSMSVASVGAVVLAGLVTALPLLLLWAVSRGRWMGFGDVKLAIGIGFLLGIMGGLSALVFAVWIGAVVSLAILFYEKLRTHRRALDSSSARLTMKSEIPFGPFLVVGALIVLFTGITLAEVIMIF